jgi:hypothetical protein
MKSVPEGPRGTNLHATLGGSGGLIPGAHPSRLTMGPALWYENVIALSAPPLSPLKNGLPGQDGAPFRSVDQRSAYYARARGSTANAHGNPEARPRMRTATWGHEASSSFPEQAQSLMLAGAATRRGARRRPPRPVTFGPPRGAGKRSTARRDGRSLATPLTHT